PATVLRLPSRLPPQNSRSPAIAVTNRARAANASVVVTAPGPRPASNALQAPLLYAPLLLRNEHRPGNARSPAGSLLPVMTIRLAPPADHCAGQRSNRSAYTGTVDDDTTPLAGASRPIGRLNTAKRTAVRSLPSMSTSVKLGTRTMSI